MGARGLDLLRFAGPACAPGHAACPTSGQRLVKWLHSAGFKAFKAAGFCLTLKTEGVKT
jgi:hypothetical protein